MPVVVKVIVDCLPLNVLQSALDKAPRLAALAVGTCKVITGVVVPLATVELKSVPVVPIVKAATDVTVPTNWSAYCGMFKVNFPKIKGNCHICNDDKFLIKTNCKHDFCLDCLMQINSDKDEMDNPCPMCRERIEFNHF